ncbi:MAG: phosphatidylethanolamine N-methyltransferase family protein, partial [Dehalococcoidia bacterium]|nr:phosphatidylethanolamine N-methyltransferase family protein [Dehalococcoidia bacterium]
MEEQSPALLAEAPRRPSPAVRAVGFVVRFVVLVIGMNGWRLDVYTRENWRDHRLPLVVWALTLTPLQSVVVGLFRSHFPIALTVSWAAFGYVAYYGSLFVIFATVGRWRHRFRDQQRLLLWYYVVQGLLFNQQSFAVMLSAALKWPWADGYVDAVLLHPAIAYTIAAGLTTIGLGIKIAATHATGLDTYYYKDMFTGQPGPEFVTSGVYKILESPMYGLGNCQLYAAAVLQHSAIGLLVAGL